MSAIFKIAYKRDHLKSNRREYHIFSHPDNAIIDHVVPHDRSISRNVAKRPNSLRTENLMRRRVIVASIKQAPKRPEEQSIDERDSKAPPNYEGADVQQRNKLSLSYNDMMLEIMPFTCSQTL